MIYVFGGYVLDTERHELQYAGEPIKLERKAYEVLAYLVEHAGRLVTKEELLQQVWPATYVHDSAVARCIGTIRRALGDRHGAQQMIQTLYGFGYRFVVEVRQPLTEHPNTSPDAPTVAPPVSAAALQPVLELTGRSSLGAWGERMLMTVMAGMISPASEFLSALDLDSQHDLIKMLDTFIQATLQPYAGTLLHFVDDRFTVVFSTPQAQEDHVARAVIAALALQQSWPTSQAMHLLPPDTMLSLGLGLHTGHVVMSETEGAPGHFLNVIGEVPLLAMHLAEQAAPGTILLSAAIAQRTPAGVRCEALNPLTIMGWPTPISIYIVVCASDR